MRKTYWIICLLAAGTLIWWLTFPVRGGANGGVSPDSKTEQNSPNEPMSGVVGIEDNINPFMAITNKDLSTDSAVFEAIEETNEIEARLLKEKGLIYTDSYMSWRDRKKEYMRLKYPRLQINLFMETEDGRVVPMSALGCGTFGWVTDRYSFYEWQARPHLDGFSNAVSYNLFRRMERVMRQKWMDDHGLESVRARPAGVRTVSVPVLPVGFTERFPELARNEESIKLFKIFLRAGEWYRFVVDGAPAPSSGTLDRRKVRTKVTYIRVPAAEDLEMGKVIVMNHVFRDNEDEHPPLNFTNHYKKEEIAKGMHLIERFGQVDVQVSSEMFDRYPELRAIHYHNIKSRGFLNSDRLSKADSSCTYRVSEIRPGGVVLATAEEFPRILMTLRKIREGKTKVLFPEDADYVLKAPVQCRVDLPDDLRKTLGTSFGSYLCVGITDGAPVAIGKLISGTSISFKVNEGEYYLRFMKNLNLMCPGKVTIQKGPSEVIITPLTEDEKAKWEKHWALLKSRHPLAKE